MIEDHVVTWQSESIDWAPVRPRVESRGELEGGVPKATAFQGLTR